MFVRVQSPVAKLWRGLRDDKIFGLVDGRDGRLVALDGTVMRGLSRKLVGHAENKSERIQAYTLAKATIRVRGHTKMLIISQSRSRWYFTW